MSTVQAGRGAAMGNASPRTSLSAELTVNGPVGSTRPLRRSSALSTDFRAAAQHYFDEYGWVTIPLVLDDNGKPKRPFSNAWQKTANDWDVIAGLPWERAQGIGIVLGEVSDNLAVIDLDSVELAAEVHRVLSEAGGSFYYVRTGSNRGHLYFREGMATSPRTMRDLQWHGLHFGIELKGRGQQVAAPPTPGYEFRGSSRTPTPVGTLEQAWAAIRTSMGIEGADSPRGGSGYPRAWQDSIKTGDRNNAIYVESCRLAEAGMPLDSAIATMLARIKQAYEGQLDERSVVSTIRSAYRKVTRPKAGWVTL